MSVKTIDPLDQMIRWENGELEPEDILDLFQHLIDCGWCWQLQGCYGRMATYLIEQGLCHPAR